MCLTKHHPVVYCAVFQGFTYVAPSVLESVKEKFSFEPKIRSPRRFIGSPRTPVRYFRLFYSFFFCSCSCMRVHVYAGAGACREQQPWVLFLKQSPSLSHWPGTWLKC